MEVHQQIGKYRVRRELGRGAMGVVYEAFDPVIEREVAIKVLNAEPMAGTSADELRSRFRREAQAVGRLSHPHIVALYDYGDSFVRDDGKPGSPYIVMEMVRGQTLKDLLDRGVRPPLADVVRWMGELLAALHHAHERGVVHRDIKPANIMLLDSGELKVADFGIARLDASDLTSTGAVMGTVSYMSPEQLLGQPVDRRTDVYACGVLLYLLLTGELPFLGSTASVMQRVLNQEPLPPATLNRTLSAAWNPVLLRALAKQPAARHATAAAFAQAIELAAQGQDDDATVVRHRLPLDAVATGPRASRGMAWRWATGGMAVLLVSVASWRVLQPATPAETQVAAAPTSPAAAPPAAMAEAPPQPTAAAKPPPQQQASTPKSTALTFAPAPRPSEPRAPVERAVAASAAARPASAPKPKPSPAASAGAAASPAPAPAPAPAPSSSPQSAADSDFARTRRECETLRAPDPGCQRILGLGYLNGRGGEKDIAKGLAWLGKAAEGGDASAQFSLAWVYLNGTGVPRDDARGAQWMRRAAGQGHTLAMNDMGWLLEYGRGVPANAPAAADWYRKGAEAGFGQSQMHYGRVLIDGIGVAKDTAKGRALVLKAVDQDRPDASYVLGLMYEQGKGVPVDRAKAAQWYRRAIARGSLRNAAWDAHAREFLAANP
jgi:TPR repeat protein